MSSNFARKSSSNDSLKPIPDLGKETQGKQRLSGITGATTTQSPGARFHSNISPSGSNPQFRSALLVNTSRAPELSVLDPDSRWDKKCGLLKLDVKPKAPKGTIFLDEDQMHILQLPFLHPLDPCNAKFSKSSLPTVTSSLRSILRILSVHVIDFSNGDPTHPAFVSCETMEQVKFVIAFWDVGSEQYCAEIQRVQGDGQTFWNYARRIMDVIQGNQTTIPSDDPLCFDLEAAKTCDTVYHTIGHRVFAKDFVVSTEELQKSMELLEEFLKTDHYDKDAIVLESLISMTNPNLSGVTSACTVAKMVLSPTSVTFRRLVSLIQSMGDRLLDDHAHVALRVAAMCCGLVGTFERNEIAESYPKFIHWLKDAATWGDPHVAYCSIHILSYFVNDGLVSDFVMPDGMLRFGTTSHAALEKACGRLSSAIATRDMK